MLGKAGELKMSECLSNSEAVNNFFSNNPNFIVMQVLISPDPETGDDYFYVIYKEESK